MGGPLPLMLVVSLRPLAHYRGIFSSVPPDYQVNNNEHEAVGVVVGVGIGVGIAPAAVAAVV